MRVDSLIQKYADIIKPYYGLEMKTGILKAETELNALDVLLEYLPPPVLLEIIDHELPYGHPDFHVKLKLMKSIVESDPALHFEIPRAASLPQQKKMTEVEAEILSREGYKEWKHTRNKHLSLPQMYLLFNNFRITGEEEEMLQELKRQDKSPWFSISGAEIWPSFRPVGKLVPDIYLFVNFGLRQSYMSPSGIPVLKNLPFGSFENLNAIEDMRHLEIILKEQTMIPGIDPKEYLFMSVNTYDLFRLSPQSIWPLFAENIPYMDKSLALYNENRPVNSVYPDIMVHVVSLFPSVPERYYHQIWNLLLFGHPGSVSYECYTLLKNTPDFGKKLEEYSHSDSFIAKNRALFWLNELKQDPRVPPKRYFLDPAENRFWNIYQVRTSYIIESGKLEQTRNPERSVEEFISRGACNKAIGQVVKNQVLKGYRETDADGVERVIRSREEKLKQELIRQLSDSRQFVSGTSPEESLGPDITETITGPDNNPYHCQSAEGFLTDISDVEYMKATLRCLIRELQKETPGTMVIGQMEDGAYAPLTNKPGQYSFDIFCDKVFRHPSLYPWLLALLQAITVRNNKAPVYTDPQTMLGMHLLFLIAFNQQDIPDNLQYPQSAIILAGFAMECGYLLHEQGWARSSVTNFMASYFSESCKGENPDVLARLFVDIIAEE